MTTKLTPMMEQYMAIKANYQDAILFFRLGDFYEMFFEDAIVASKVLEITLTGRNQAKEEKAPMCGVPHHAAENYIQKLVNNGYKVAICEQVEDVLASKGIVKRDVVRVVTKGTTLNTQSIEQHRNNYLMCIYQNIAHYGIAYVDITTGDFFASHVDSYHKIIDEVAKIQPSEIVVNQVVMEHIELHDYLTKQLSCYMHQGKDYFYEKNRCEEVLKRHFKIPNLSAMGIDFYNESIIASGALMQYLQDTQKQELNHIGDINYYNTTDYMLLDISTRRNLELIETMRTKERRGSLMWVLDHTKTAMGARRLRSFIEQPLLSLEEIVKRQEAVAALVGNQVLLAEYREVLSPIYDFERLISKLSLKTANGRDLVALKQSLSMLPAIAQLLDHTESQLFSEIKDSFDGLEDIHEKIEAAIVEEPPITIREGGLLKASYHPEIAKLRSASIDGKQWLAELETRERNATGIKGLKVQYNKVFGYYIELTKSYMDMAPDHYERKQTLANAERYVIPELKEMESTILGAKDRLMTLEYELFVELRDSLISELSRIKETAMKIALIDAIGSLAEAANKNGYTMPKMVKSSVLDIKEGRHPVIEKMISHDLFIHNDTYLDCLEHRFSIITGPNMAGKSTYMRQVALIVLMAQIGSFVPAKEATLGCVDRIFTRVGASDDLASGQSTFMVEMTEVAGILRNATKDSLIILDEIGRGTSTFDGLSIAWAVVEYIVNKKRMGAKTLFATHYHELTELEGRMEGVQNYLIDVRENGDDIIFLRKIIPGGANKSYGIQVARLAGVPEAVILRSMEILKELSDSDINMKHKVYQIAEPAIEPVQLNLFEPVEHPVIGKMKALNLNELTPLEALNLLSQYKKEL